MASRLTESAKTRKSLPLTERDLADIARLRGETPEREALARIAGVAMVGEITESALLRMVFAAGLRAIWEKTEEYSYEAEARRESGDDDESRRIARRRRPAWANEG